MRGNFRDEPAARRRLRGRAGSLVRTHRWNRSPARLHPAIGAGTRGATQGSSSNVAEEPGRCLRVGWPVDGGTRRCPGGPVAHGLGPSRGRARGRIVVRSSYGSTTCGIDPFCPPAYSVVTAPPVLGAWNRVLRALSASSRGLSCFETKRATVPWSARARHPWLSMLSPLRRATGVHPALRAVA